MSEKLVELIVSYGLSQCKEFLNSFVQADIPQSSWGTNSSISHANYILYLSRACLDRNFYRSVNIPEQYLNKFVEGICIECVLTDDEETFQNVYTYKNHAPSFDILEASYRIKYAKKMLAPHILSLHREKRKSS